MDGFVHVSAEDASDIMENNQEDPNNDSDNSNNIFSDQSVTQNERKDALHPQPAPENETSNATRRENNIECDEEISMTVERSQNTAEATAQSSTDLDGSLSNILHPQPPNCGDSFNQSTNFGASDEWSLHPDEGLPIRYKPPQDDDFEMIETVLDHSLTRGLLEDPEELLESTKEKKNNSDDNVDNKDVENIEVLETYDDEVKGKKIVFRFGSFGLSRDLLVMLSLLVLALCSVLVLRRYVIWEEVDPNHPSSTPSSSFEDKESSSFDEEEVSNANQPFHVSETFTQKIHGVGLETFDLRQIHKFQSILAGYTDLYANDNGQVGEDEQESVKQTATTIPEVKTQCVLINQVLSSYERKRKHQPDDNDATRRQLAIFHGDRALVSLQVDFTMTYSSAVDIIDKFYPRKFQQYANKEEGREQLLSDLRDMGLDVEGLGDLYLKGADEVNDTLSSAQTTYSSSPDQTDPHSTVFDHPN